VHLSAVHGESALPESTGPTGKRSARKRACSVWSGGKAVKPYLSLPYFEPLITLRQVYDEVVMQGNNRPGARELAAAYDQGAVRLAEIKDHTIIDQLRQMSAEVPATSDVDILVLALALAQHAILLTDDHAVRTLVLAHGVPVIGSIGILISARLDGIIPTLKPFLDQLVKSGFYLDPQGQVYREALRRVGEN
jgi:predicted nucleic acid-binding protein